MARTRISSEISKLSKQKIIPATVVDVLGRFCSVRLSGVGKLLHSLIFLGTSPSIGETVYVDYRSGTPIVHTTTGNMDDAISAAVAGIAIPSSSQVIPSPTETVAVGRQHNDLSGVQGGQQASEGTPAEYYHLTEDEHSDLGNFGAFISLSDAPIEHSYEGQKYSLVRVRSAEDGLEFTRSPGLNIRRDVSEQIDGAVQHFNLSDKYVSLRVYYNGLTLVPRDYHLDEDGLGFTLTSIPFIGDTILVEGCKTS